MCRIHDPIQWFKFFYGPLENAGDLGKPRNGLLSFCLITVMHSATGARHENKEVGTFFKFIIHVSWHFKVELGHVFLHVIWFSSVSIIPPRLSIDISEG
jgi:hypothetical protein